MFGFIKFIKSKLVENNNLLWDTKAKLASIESNINDKVDTMSQGLAEAGLQRDEDAETIKRLEDRVASVEEHDKEILEKLNLLLVKRTRTKTEKPEAEEQPKQLTIEFKAENEQEEAQQKAITDILKRSVSQTEDPDVRDSGDVMFGQAPEAQEETETVVTEKTKKKKNYHRLIDAEVKFIIEKHDEGLSDKEIAKQMNIVFAEIYRTYDRDDEKYVRREATVTRFFESLEKNTAKSQKAKAKVHHKTQNSIWANEGNFNKVIELLLSGYTYPEIAKQMGVTPASIQSHLSKRKISQSGLLKEIRNFLYLKNGGTLKNDGASWSNTDRKRLPVLIGYGFPCSIIAKCLLRTDGSVKREAFRQGYSYSQDKFNVK